MNALRLLCPCTMHPRLCLLALEESITAFLFDTGSERRDHHEGGQQPSWSSSGWWWAKACLPRQRWGSRCRRPSTGSSSQHACWPMRRVPPPRWWHCPRRSYRLNAPDRGRPRSFSQTDELHRIPHLDPSTHNTPVTITPRRLRRKTSSIGKRNGRFSSAISATMTRSMVRESATMLA